MVDKYIDPGVTGGSPTGNWGDAYGWDTVVWSNDTTYHIRSNTTYQHDSASRLIDFRGLSTVGIDVWDDGGTLPRIESFRDIKSLTWTDDAAGEGANYWYTSSTGLAFINNRERVFADRVALKTLPNDQADWGAETLGTNDYRVWWDSARSRLYIYSTADPGGSPGGIDGGGEALETLYDTDFVDIGGANGVTLKNFILDGGATMITNTLTSNLESLVVDSVEHYRNAVNRKIIDLIGTTSFNMKGIEVKNCTFDKTFTQNEDYLFTHASDDGLRFRGNVGPASGSAGDGVHIHDCTFVDFGHNCFKFDETGSDQVRNRYGLVEDCTMTFTKVNHGRAFAINGPNSASHVVRDLLITSAGAPIQFTGNGHEIYNLIIDSQRTDQDPQTGDPSASAYHSAAVAIDNSASNESAINLYLHDITIYNSVNAAINFHTGAMGSSPSGNRFENILMDTCATTPTDATTARHAIVMRAGSYAAAQSITWKNCCVYHASVAKATLINNADGEEAYFITSTGGVSNINDDSTDLGNMSGFVEADPGLNTTTWQVSNTGSAYNAGVNTGSGADYYNNPRPGAGASRTAYDIGAVEYQDDSGGSVSSAPHTYSLRRKIAVL